ncbi:MAG: glycosyltransferase [Nitrososphaerales archaeon]
MTLEQNWAPMISVIIPSRNEKSLIVSKLNNVIESEYKKIEIILVDSSDDTTRSLAQKWQFEHPEVVFKILQDQKRVSKADAMNQALSIAAGDLITISDVDSFWKKDSLSKVTAYMSGRDVGAVTTTKLTKTDRDTSVVKEENAYRNFYNTIRLGESKLFATPIIHGELSCFRKELLTHFDDTPFSDDSGTAVALISKGYRVILIDDTQVSELAPTTRYWIIKQKYRRAMGASLLFRKRIKMPKEMFWVWSMEKYLHLINPFLVVLTIPVTVALLFIIPILSIALVILLIPTIRSVLVEYYFLNMLLFAANITISLRKPRSVIWEQIKETRAGV